MNKVAVANPDLVSKTTSEGRTYLAADYSSGTTLTVRSTNGFTADYFLVVGEPTQEQTECRRASAISDSATFTIATALSYSHPKSTVVYQSQYDKISFEQKASGGSFTAISGSPFSIDWGNTHNETLVTVSDGATTDTYRWRYYNSYSGAYSSYSDELAGTGLARTSVGFIIQQVRKNPITTNIEDETLIDYCNDFQELVYDKIPKAWWFSKGGTAVATAASDYDYSISTNWSDFLSMEFMLYRYISGSVDITYPLTWSPPTEMRSFKSDANQGTDDYVKYWSLYPPDSSSAKGYIILHPTPKTANCYLKPVYYYELTSLDSFGDTLVVPKPKGYMDYILYRIYDDIKSDKGNADKYEAKVNGSIIALKQRARRQLGQEELFRFRGHRGWSKLFGEQSRLDSSTATENYWSP